MSQPSGKPPRVGIIVPSHDMVHANFAMAFAAMTYSLGIPVAIFNQKGSNVAQNRNYGVAGCQKHKLDYAFFIDSDMTFPATALLRLLAHRKEIVGATYARRSPPHNNMAIPLKNRKTVAHGLTEVAAIPTGMMLVHMSVFEKMKRPYFRFPTIEEGQGLPPEFDGLVPDDKNPRILGEDYSFCFLAAHRFGIKTWLDVELSYELIHWGEQGTRLKENGENEPGFEIIELPAAFPVGK